MRQVSGAGYATNHRTSAIVFLVCVAGCTSYNLLKPVTPPVGNPKSEPEEVTSLQPTLSWEKSADAGHAAQSVCLQAVALGLGTVPVGAFRDEEVKEVLKLGLDESPVYLMPVGRK